MIEIESNININIEIIFTAVSLFFPVKITNLKSSFIKKLLNSREENIVVLKVHLILIRCEGAVRQESDRHLQSVNITRPIINQRDHWNERKLDCCLAVLLFYQRYQPVSQ